MAFHCSSSDPVSQNASISGRENGINGIKCILGSKCWLCQHQAELGHPFLLHQEFPLGQQCPLGALVSYTDGSGIPGRTRKGFPGKETKDKCEDEDAGED